MPVRPRSVPSDRIRTNAPPVEIPGESRNEIAPKNRLATGPASPVAAHRGANSGQFGKFLGHRCSLNSSPARSDLHASFAENEAPELRFRHVRPVSYRGGGACGWHWDGVTQAA